MRSRISLLETDSGVDPPFDLREANVMRELAESPRNKTNASATRRALLGAIAATGAAATLPAADARAATKLSEEEVAYKLGLEANV